MILAIDRYYFTTHHWLAFVMQTSVYSETVTQFIHIIELNFVFRWVNQALIHVNPKKSLEPKNRDVHRTALVFLRSPLCRRLDWKKVQTPARANGLWTAIPFPEWWLYTAPFPLNVTSRRIHGLGTSCTRNGVTSLWAYKSTGQEDVAWVLLVVIQQHISHTTQLLSSLEKGQSTWFRTWFKSGTLLAIFTTKKVIPGYNWLPRRENFSTENSRTASCYLTFLRRRPRWNAIFDTT
jgi:hypothetical protein